MKRLATFAFVMLVGCAPTQTSDAKSSTSPALSFQVRIRSCLGAPIDRSVSAGGELGHFVAYDGHTTTSTYGFIRTPRGTFTVEAHWPWPDSAGLRPPGQDDLPTTWGPFDEYDAANGMPMLVGPDGPPYCGAAD
jgi:hypothetical protein